MGNIKKVALWGVGPLAAEFLGILKKMEIEVTKIIDLYAGKGRFNGIQVELPEIYLKSCDTSIPIIVTAESKNNTHRYFEICQYVDQLILEKGELYPKDIKLLHPAVIFSNLLMDLSYQFAISGFPGSGNILIGNIIRMLNPENKSFNKANSLFHHIANSHFSVIKKELSEHLKYFGSVKIFFNNEKINCAEVLAIADDGFIKVRNIKTPNYLRNRVYTSHEVLTKETVAFLKKNKIPIITIIRNPLDIIVSNAFKISQNHLFHAQKNMPDIAEKWVDSGSYLRQLWCIGKLACLDWFNNLIFDIMDFYEKIYSCQKDVLIVRYERLLSEPYDEIRRIGEYIGREYSNDLLKMATTMVGRPLSSDPTHFNNPGVEKWKIFLTENHINLLHKERFFDIMSEFGYSMGNWKSDTIGKKIPSLPDQENRFLNHYLQDLKIPFEVNYRTIEIPNGINIAGNSRTLMNALLSSFYGNKRSINRILGSIENEFLKSYTY